MNVCILPERNEETVKEITLCKPKGFADWLRLWSLYMEAFPASERKPFSMILKMRSAGKTDVWCLMEQGAFRGLAITINSPELVLLDYFAVCKEHRGTGVGHGAFPAILQQYQDRGVFLEIENPELPGADQAVRQRRKAFYRSCGLEELGVKVVLFGVPMELLGVRCAMTFEKYRDFFRQYYDPWVAEHVTEK